jgi:hypothetical protein
MLTQYSDSLEKVNFPFLLKSKFVTSCFVRKSLSLEKQIDLSRYSGKLDFLQQLFDRQNNIHSNSNNTIFNDGIYHISCISSSQYNGQ